MKETESNIEEAIEPISQDEILKENAECITAYIESKYSPRCNSEQIELLDFICEQIQQYALGITDNEDDDDDDEEYYDFESQQYYSKPPRCIYYYCYEFNFKNGTVGALGNDYFKRIIPNNDFSLLYIKFDTFGVSIKYGVQKIFMPFNPEAGFQGMPTKKELGI